MPLDSKMPAAYSHLMHVPGTIVAQRYRLDSLIGRGGQGEVWAATDLLLDETVALKRFGAQATDWSRIRREIATLRRLRLPGVVRLLDEGLDEYGTFLVMEHVPGEPIYTPHPGIRPERTTIVNRSIEVLGILARVHAAGVVHRDLKPENIIVAQGEIPVLIDFGLASLPALDLLQLINATFAGTYFYCAPEQLRDEPVDGRTDLYALGVMLYEALAGRLPHRADSLDELIALRLSSPPLPLAEVAPDVPPHVAQVVDALLAIEPADRPPSAYAVSRALRNHCYITQHLATLPRLGSDNPVRHVLQAVWRGVSLELIGRRGSGRSRCLDEVAQQLIDNGSRVMKLNPDQRPFSSLEKILGPVQRFRATTLNEAASLAEAMVAAVLHSGAILLVDDADHLDRHSLQVLERCRNQGAIVFARERPVDEYRVTVWLQPLLPEDLEPLFAGPNRLFHLATDAAAILHERTHGLQGRVVSELSVWERSGLARRHAELITVDRDTLDHLSIGFFATASGNYIGACNGALGILTSWIFVAFPHASVELLANAMGEPRWRVEAEVDELVRLGKAQIDDRGIVELIEMGTATATLTKQREMHAAIANVMPEHSIQRAVHALAAYAGGSSFAANELAGRVIPVAKNLEKRGQLGRAIALLAEALRVLGDLEEAFTARVELIREWMLIAMQDRTPKALDRVICEMSRIDPSGSAFGDVERLIRAATAIRAGADRAETLAESLHEYSDVRFELIRRDLRVIAARRTAQEKLESLIVESEAWADSMGTAETCAAALVWRGRFEYQRGDFVRAAEIFERAASIEPNASGQALALFHAGASWLEAFQLDNAWRCAEQARVLAEEHRHAYDEARAEWLIRTIGYRQGALLEPDLALVDAVADVGSADLEALVCCTEAAVAFRLRDKPTTIRLAERARRLWTGMKKTWAALGARSLALAVGTGTLIEEARCLAKEAAACHVPGLGVQVLGLLAMGFPGERLTDLHIAQRLANQVPRAFWSHRIDVLSVEEALRAITAPKAERQ